MEQKISDQAIKLNTLTKDLINAAEEKNYYDLLKKTIENDLIKNGLLSKYITSDKVIDFAKIKQEMEEYKKQLVLAQSMINSLKSDLIDVTKENENYKKKISKLNILSNENELLKAENMTLELKYKDTNKSDNNDLINKIKNDYDNLLNENKNIEKENQILNDQIEKFKNQINQFKNIINNKNCNLLDNNKINLDKVKYFDEYITNNKRYMKKLLSQLFNLINLIKEESIKTNNKNLLSKSSFLLNIDYISIQITSLIKSNTYEVELNDDMFFSLLEKFFDLLKNNFYFNETNLKIEYLQKDLDETLQDFNETKMNNFNLSKENSKIKNELVDLNNRFNNLKFLSDKNEKFFNLSDSIVKRLLKISINFIKNIPDDNLIKIINNIYNLIEQKYSAEINKILSRNKLDELQNYNEKEIKNNDLSKHITNEKDNLEFLISELNKKILIKNQDLKNLMNKYELFKDSYIHNLEFEKENNNKMKDNNKILKNEIIKINNENKELKENNNNQKTESDNIKKNYSFSNNDNLFYRTKELLDKNTMLNINNMKIKS